MIALLVVLAYLAGSVPWGFLAARSAGVDIRTKGSGNTGATNVWRVLGRRYGIPVMVLDVAKGALPVLVGQHAFGSGVAIVAGAAAVLGHTFPVFLGFSGGKGVATTAGVVIAITPIVALGMIALMVALLWLFRYVSLASMCCAVAYPLACLATGQPWPVLVFGTLAAAGIVARHRANIVRLRAGTEPKISRFGRGT